MRKRTPRRKQKRKPQSTAAMAAFDSRAQILEWVGLAFLLLLAFVVYLPALNGSLLWDDQAHITRPDLQSIRGLYGIWFELGVTQQYYPLLHTAFWIEHKVWGDSVLGYHLINLAWHMLSVVLVYTILRKLKIPGALLACAIFALHPVMVESVAWISEQKNTLSAVFYLSALLIYLNFDQSRRRSQYAVALALFVLGLLTKTVTATLPAALLVIFWWQRGKLSWKRDVFPLVPLFLLGVVAGALTAWIERKLIGAEGADFQMTFLERGLLAGRVVWFYLMTLLWPAKLTFIYPRWQIDPTVWWQWLFPIATLGVTIALWAVRHKLRGPLAGWLLFVGTLFPVLGFLNVFPFIYSYVADHFQYLASLGLIVLVAAGVTLVLARLPKPGRMLGNCVCGLLVATLGVLSWQQAGMYADNITLYRTTLERNPNCWMAHYNWGLELEANGDRNGAIEHYRAAHSLTPRSSELNNNLGLALMKSGRAQEAVEYLEQSLEIRPDNAEAHNNLGLAMSQLGHAPKGIEHIRRAVQIRPAYADAHNNLANTLKTAGRFLEAIDEYRAATELQPDDPVILNNLGNALSHVGRFAEARENIELALQLKPDFAEAHYNLGIAMAGIGDAAMAVENFESALRLRPDYVEAHNNLGEILRRTGRTDEAIKHFQEALRMKPDNAAAHDNLGIALAEVGNTAEAIEEFRRALKLNKNDANVHNNLGIVLLQMGKADESISHYEQAVRLRPDFADAHSGLAEALRQAGQPQKAIEHYETALRLKPDFLQAYISLAVVLSSQNRSGEAIATAEKGIAVARSTGHQAQAEQIEEWLKHYRAELRRNENGAPSKAD